MGVLRERRLWPLVVLLVLLPLVVWKAYSRPDPDRGKLRVTVLDVGQGDSIAVETPGGHMLLIDGGGENNESRADQTDVGLRVVVPYLRYRGVNRVDVLVLTHPHGDHVGGLPAVLRAVPIGVILDGTVLPYPSPAYALFRSEAARRHIPVRAARRGMTLDFGDGVTAQVLNPPAGGTPYGTNPDDATVNNYSAVVLLRYGRTRFLLTGDAETAAEDSLLAAYPDLRCDVLKAGHHGARNATGDAWLVRLRPRYAAISCGQHNLFGHPSPATLERLAMHHVQTFRTDKNGAISFVSDGRTVTARPFLP